MGNTLRLDRPMALTAADFRPGSDPSLHRCDVDRVARTLDVRTPLPSPDGSGKLFGDHSLQFGSTVSYLAQGQLLAAPW